jgi:pimeloyl-ACP methyl ester carboxylesterase
VPPQEDLLSRLDSKADLRRVPFSQGHVAWRGFGEGPPLALLHGGHGSWLHWARNIEALAATHRVWVADLPGYGLSNKPEQLTLDSLVDATRQTLDQLVGEEAPLRLTGFSFGGFAAARLAQQRGGVTHLAMLGPGGSVTPRRAKGQLLAWRDLPVGSDDFHAVMRRNLALHMLHDEAALDATALQIHEQACLATHFPSKRISLAGGLADALQGSPAKVLLVCGEHDVTLTPADTEKLVKQAVPGARSELVAGAGHWVQYEAAQRTNELLLDFLRT